MRISLKGIKYRSPIVVDEKPFVVDVATLNRQRQWGLQIQEEDTWSRTYSQLELVASVSIEVYKSDSIDIVSELHGKTIELDYGFEVAAAAPLELAVTEALDFSPEYGATEVAISEQPLELVLE